MTILSTITKQSFECNGSLREFDFDFTANSADDIKALILNPTGVETELTALSQYSVTLNPDGSGGTLTTVATWATGNTLIVYRVTDHTQETEYKNNQVFDQNVLEKDLDKIMMMMQETDETYKRTINVPLSDSTNNYELPSAKLRAGNILGFDSEGKPICDISEASIKASLSAIDVELVWVDPRQYGSTFDDITLGLAIASIGANNRTLVIPPGMWSINNNLIIPSNVTLRVERGGILQIANGKTLTINGSFEAGLCQVFDCVGTGVVSNLSITHPEWFGAKGNDTTDDTIAIMNADKALISGGTLLFSEKTYRFTSLTSCNDYRNWVGCGRKTILKTTLSPTIITVPAIWIKHSYFIIKDLSITWATSPTVLVANNPIERNNTLSIGFSEVPGGVGGKTILDVEINGIYIDSGKQHGIGIGRSHGVKVIGCVIENIYATGLWSYYSCDLEIASNRIYNSHDDSIFCSCCGVTRGKSVGEGDDDFTYNINIHHNTIIDSYAKGIGVCGTYGGRISDNYINNTWASGIWAIADPNSGDVNNKDVIISGNTLLNIFENYGAGQYRTVDAHTATGGIYQAILVGSDNFAVISNNTIYSDSVISFGYRAIQAVGGSIVISSNNIFCPWSLAIVVGNDTPINYNNVTSFSFVGNNLTIASGCGVIAISLFGVSGGVISGNYIDAGGQGLSAPAGQLYCGWYAKNTHISSNITLNYIEGASQASFVNYGNCSNINYVDIGTDNQATSHRSGVESPVGLIRPLYVGEEYYDTAGHWYKSHGMGWNDWTALN